MGVRASLLYRRGPTPLRSCVLGGRSVRVVFDNRPRSGAVPVSPAVRAERNSDHRSDRLPRPPQALPGPAAAPVAPTGGRPQAVDRFSTGCGQRRTGPALPARRPGRPGAEAPGARRPDARTRERRRRAGDMLRSGVGVARVPRVGSAPEIPRHALRRLGGDPATSSLSAWRGTRRRSPGGCGPGRRCPCRPSWPTPGSPCSARGRRWRRPGRARPGRRPPRRPGRPSCRHRRTARKRHAISPAFAFDRSISY